MRLEIIMDYKKIIEIRNETNLFAKHIGLFITEMKEGYAKCSMKIHSEHLNPVNAIHGGVLFTIADVTGGAAASSYGYHIVTADSDFHFLNAGLNTTEIYATATKLKVGKRLMVFDVSVFDQDHLLLCKGTFTYARLKNKILD